MPRAIVLHAVGPQTKRFASDLQRPRVDDARARPRGWRDPAPRHRVVTASRACWSSSGRPADRDTAPEGSSPRLSSPRHGGDPSSDPRAGTAAAVTRRLPPPRGAGTIAAVKRSPTPVRATVALLAWPLAGPARGLLVASETPVDTRGYRRIRRDGRGHERGHGAVAAGPRQRPRTRFARPATRAQRRVGQRAARPLRRPDDDRPRRRACTRRRHRLERQRRWPALDVPVAARRALVERRPAGGAGLRRGAAPPRRSCDALAVRAGGRLDPQRAGGDRRTDAARRARRGGARSGHRRDRTGQPDALPARPDVALVDDADPRAEPRAPRRRLREAGQARHQRRVPPRRLGAGLAHRPRAQPPVLERRRQPHRRGALGVAVGRERRIPPLPQRRAARHLHRAARPVRAGAGATTAGN